MNKVAAIQGLLTLVLAVCFVYLLLAMDQDQGLYTDPILNAITNNASVAWSLTGITVSYGLVLLFGSFINKKTNELV